METLLAFFGGTAGSWILGLAGFASVGAILDWLLKKYITEDVLDSIRDWLPSVVDDIGTGFGEWLNAAGNAAPVVGKFWNKTIEPWVIIFLRTIVMSVATAVVVFVDHVIIALQSDNPSTKE